MYGYGGYYISDDNDTPRECSYHNMIEKLLFGVHTFWYCTKCQKDFEFKEIQKRDDIAIRVSIHKLPWE